MQSCDDVPTKAGPGDGNKREGDRVCHAKDRCVEKGEQCGL